ncbi:MAG: [Fe-S]-binding protein, partial [Bacteroidetes bacterium]|nr:[Fe-S]-binding protein [Bacteroidota bacterium]
QVGALLVYGANPAYTYFDADRVKKAIAKVKLTVSFNERLDETSELCQFIIPAHHYLESWGDAEPKAGYISFQQPTIHPLFKTRPYQTSLLKWAGNTTDYDTYFKNYWTAKLGSESAFDSALQNGVIEPTAVTPVAGAYNGAAVSTAASQVSSGKKVSGDEIVLYQKVSLGTGSQAGNPWLQELPDPISKATWGNYAIISIAKAKELGIKLDNDYEYYPEKPVIKITAGQKTIELPVLVFPGMNASTIAVALGYGRCSNIGKAATNDDGTPLGVNIYPFAVSNGTTVDYFAPVTVAGAGRKEKIAQMQIQNSYEGRTEVVKQTTLATFKKYPNQFKEFREELKKEFAPVSGDFSRESTLYDDHLQPGLKWGMSIDMNSCTACNACVVACHA